MKFSKVKNVRNAIVKSKDGRIKGTFYKIPTRIVGINNNIKKLNQGRCRLYNIFTPVLESSEPKKPDEENYENIEKYSKTPLLIIDDLGKERPSEWTLEKLFTIVNNRYENNLPIIITTNYNKEKLRRRLLCNSNEEIVDSIISRLYEMCRGIIIFGKDKRKELV